jgi:hypothetical protein
MSQRVRVHHFVLAELVRPEDVAWRVCDLFRVSHWRAVPVDTEFPFTVPRMQLFARFYLLQARPMEFRVRVPWLDAPDRVSRVIGHFGPFVIPFAQNAAARDCSFNLHNVQLQGVGMHCVELVRNRRVRWSPGKRVRVATTYFVVER